MCFLFHKWSKWYLGRVIFGGNRPTVAMEFRFCTKCGKHQERSTDG